MLTFQLILLGVLLVLSAFFSGSETALMAVSKFKVKHLLDKKKRGAKTLYKLKSKPQRLLITILVGNNIVNIGASALATVIFTDLFGSSGAGIAVGVMTFLVLLFGEITPKSFAIRHASGMSLAISPVIYITGILLFPITIVFAGLMKIADRLFGGEEETITPSELKTIVEMGRDKGIFDRKVAKVIHNVLEFKDIRADEVMTPSVEVLTVDANQKIKDVVDFVNKTQYSKYPIHDENKENIIGYLHVDDVLRVMTKKKGKTKIKKIARPVTFIPETEKVDTLLTEFEKNNLAMAVVVSEYGKPIGIVTLPDILEEIVGEIFKQKESVKYITKKKKYAIVSGVAPIDVVNKSLGTNIKDDHFNTIAGHVMHDLQRMPKKGDVIKKQNIKIKVTKVSKKAVEKVRIYKK